MTDEAMSPLRRRMIEDMTIRKFASKTQHDYVQRVKNFAAFLGRSPDTASFEDVRRYQLHLAASGVGVSTLNQTVSTLRFFFRVTLRRHDIVEHTPWRLRTVEEGASFWKSGFAERIDHDRISHISGLAPVAQRKRRPPRGVARAGRCRMNTPRRDSANCQSLRRPPIIGL